jgi:DNA-binding CsgD family transcriptional regulator
MEKELTDRSRRHWSPREEAILRERYGTVTSAEIGKLLGRTALSVRNRAYVLKLTAVRPKAAEAPGTNGSAVPRQYRDWTEAELDLLREQYHQKPAQAIADQLGRSIWVVRNMANKLGLMYRRPTAPEVPLFTLEAAPLTSGYVQSEDLELSAMSVCLHALEPLAEPVRARVLNWLVARLVRC